MYFPECFAMNAGISATYFLKPPKSFTDRSSTRYAFIFLPRESSSDPFAVRMVPVLGFSTAPSLAGLADNLRKVTVVISWKFAIRVKATSGIGQSNILYDL